MFLNYFDLHVCVVATEIKCYIVIYIISHNIDMQSQKAATSKHLLPFDFKRKNS